MNWEIVGYMAMWIPAVALMLWMWYISKK